MGNSKSTKKPSKKRQKRRLKLKTKRKNGRTSKPGAKTNDKKPRPLVPNENRKRRNEKQRQKLLRNSESKCVNKNDFWLTKIRFCLLSTLTLRNTTILSAQICS